MRSKLLSIFAALSTALALAPIASAQSRLPGPGARIRITTTPSRVFLVPVTARSAPGARPWLRTTPKHWIAGTLMSVRDDEVTIETDAKEIINVPRRVISKLERSEGRLSRGRHALWGLAAGAGVGAVLGMTSDSCQPHSIVCLGPAVSAGGGALLGAAAGVTVGALLPPEERWIDVPDRSFSTIPEAPVVPPSPQPARGMTIAVGTGYASSGPAKDLEAAMRSAGFNDSMQDTLFGSGTILHPYSVFDGFPASLDVNWTLPRRWQLKTTLSRAPMGETLGYHSPAYYLFVDYRVTSLETMVTKTLGPIQIGAGASWCSVETRNFAATMGSSGGWTHRSRAGAVAEITTQLPRKTKFFLNISGRYRYLGRVTVGPFVAQGYFNQPPLTFQADVRFNHWIVTVGPGLRF